MASKASLTTQTQKEVAAKPSAARYVTRIDSHMHYLDWGELWRYRETLVALISRDIKIRYKQTLIGGAWAVLQPLITMVVFTAIFSGVVRIASDGLPYAVFSFTALVPWTFFSNGLSLGADSLVGQSHLIRKIYFPRIIIPLARVLGGLLDFSLSTIILLILVLSYALSPRPEALWAVPLLVVMMVMTTFGFTLIFSSWNVRYRDIRYLVPYLVQLGMFVSPVVYSTSQLDEPVRILFGLNPMTTVIDGFRWVLAGGVEPLGGTTLVSFLTMILIVVSGTIVFYAAEGEFADII